MPQPVTKHVRFHTQLRHVTWQVPADSEESPPQCELTDEANTPESPEDLAPDAEHEQALDTARLETLLEEILESVRELDGRRNKSIGELQQVAVELSVAVASHLVGRKLDVSELGVETLVEQAVLRLDPYEPVVIHINELDKAALEETCGDKLKSLEQSVSIVGDEKLPRGACHATAGDFGLRSTLEQRLATIRENLLQGIEYAQIERRQDGTSGGGLRRFPDRRQTA